MIVILLLPYVVCGVLAFMLHKMRRQLNAVAAAFDRMPPLGDLNA